MDVQSVKHSARKGGVNLGYKIKEMREQKGMTQEELAIKSGISRGTISALENGTFHNVMSSTLIKLAKALNTTVDHIFFSDSV